jgi:hypothetical protein
MLRLLLLPGMVLTLIAPSPAADKPAADPPELIAKRDEYLRTLQRVQAPVLAGYVRTLESLKIQFTREGKLDAALATDAELKLMDRQLTAANNVNKGATPVMLTITSVKFGDPKSNRLVDVSKVVLKAFNAGDASIELSGGKLYPGKDPAPFVHKVVVVEYMSMGERKEKTFQDGTVIKFKTDLP